MIKRFGDYDTTRVYTDSQALPKGAYTLKILNASVEQNSVGQYIKIACDVADGEFKDFYMNEYKAQTREDKKWRCNYLLNIPNDDGSEKDGWTKSKFKTVITAIEDSNPGFHWGWDETTLKGKTIGGLFNIRQYKGNDGTVRDATNLARLISTESIKSGKYKMPEDKLLEVTKTNVISGSEEWMSVDNASSPDLPWG